MQNEEDVKKLASRSVSIRSIIELWSAAKCTQSLHNSLKSYPLNLSYFAPEKSFKIEVETYGKRFSQKEKVDKIEVNIILIETYNFAMKD